MGNTTASETLSVVNGLTGVTLTRYTLPVASSLRAGVSRSQRSLRPPFQWSEPSEPTGSRDRGNPKVKEQPHATTIFPNDGTNQGLPHTLSISPRLTTEDQKSRERGLGTNPLPALLISLPDRCLNLGEGQGVKRRASRDGRVLQPRDNPESLLLDDPLQGSRRLTTCKRPLSSTGKPKVDRLNLTTNQNQTTTPNTNNQNQTPTSISIHSSKNTTPTPSRSTTPSSLTPSRSPSPSSSPLSPSSSPLSPGSLSISILLSGRRVHGKG